MICASGFAFFAMLPFANNCLDYLVRTNIAEESLSLQPLSRHIFCIPSVTSTMHT